MSVPAVPRVAAQCAAVPVMAVIDAESGTDLTKQVDVRADRVFPSQCVVLQRMDGGDGRIDDVLGVSEVLVVGHHSTARSAW